MIEMSESSDIVRLVADRAALAAGILGMVGATQAFQEAVSSGMSASIEAVVHVATANPEIVGLLALGTVRLGAAAKRTVDDSDRQHANPNELSDDCRNL